MGTISQVMAAIARSPLRRVDLTAPMSAARQGQHLAALTDIHRDLARVRGSVRARRGDGLVAQDAVDPGNAPGQVLALLRGLPFEAIAPLDRIDRLPERTEGPRTPLRFGTTRIGVGGGRCVDLPVIVPLLDVGHLVINAAAPGSAGASCPAAIHAIVDNLVLRALATTKPGDLVVIADGWLPNFLRRADVRAHRLVLDVDPAAPGHLNALLSALRQDIERIQRLCRASGRTSLAQLAATTGSRPEPWRLLVLSRLGHLLGAQQAEELWWLLRTGPACGIHAILIDTPVPPDLPTETVYVSPYRIRVSTAGPLLDVRPDSEPLPGSPVLVVLDRRLAGGPASSPT